MAELTQTWNYLRSTRYRDITFFARATEQYGNLQNDRPLS
jgi:hypothetical protein